MKSHLLAAAAALSASVIALGAASAHHSPLAVFNMNKTTEIDGSFTKINWVNPHVFFEVTTKGTGGKPVVWKFESQPPAFFSRAGIHKKDMVDKVGKPVKVQLNPAVDGSTIGWAKLFSFPDGSKIQLGGL